MSMSQWFLFSRFPHSRIINCSYIYKTIFIINKKKKNMFDDAIFVVIYSSVCVHVIVCIYVFLCVWLCDLFGSMMDSFRMNRMRRLKFIFYSVWLMCWKLKFSFALQSHLSRFRAINTICNGLLCFASCLLFYFLIFQFFTVLFSHAISHIYE